MNFLNFKYLQKPVEPGSVQVLDKEMVKLIFWFISNPAIWSDKKCRPANVFYKTEKIRLVFGYSKTPMEVPIMVALNTIR